MSLILTFPDYAPQGRALAEALGWDHAPVAVHRFPDGESLVRLPASLPPRVVLCRSLDHPNDKLLELTLAADAARDLGARDLTLVAPYLAYMRQDIAFHPGEAVSQRIVGRHLARHFDAVITVDPHLHRIHRLAEAIPAQRADALSSAPLLGAFLTEQTLGQPLLLGPDEESAQWVGAIAAAHNLEWAVARKVRRGDRDVAVELPPLDLGGRVVVLVDDMASTGRTLAGAARQALERGARAVHALVVHALFMEDALDHLRAAGVGRVWSTDSIPHPTNAVALASLLAGALRDA